MKYELSSIQNNNTRQLENLPNKKKAFEVKWMFKTTMKTNGQVAKYKACFQKFFFFFAKSRPRY